MKTHVAWLTILCLVLATAPVLAQVLYDDGPINGTTDAWTINFGYIVSDTFILLNNSTATGFNFGAWEFPGDVLTSVQWSITSKSINGGTVYGSGTASGSNLNDKFLSQNEFGFDIDLITVSNLNVAEISGTQYWLTLANAMIPSGDPVYWDENSGIGCKGDNGMGGGCPSGAAFGFEPIPPEAFDITGTSGGTTPEPSSIVLFASGVLGVAGLKRRKLF